MSALRLLPMVCLLPSPVGQVLEMLSAGSIATIKKRVGEHPDKDESVDLGDVWHRGTGVLTHGM